MVENINSLIQSFILSTIAHHDATLNGDWRGANKSARKRHKIFLQIVEAGDTAREALLAQTKNDNIHIALIAAVYSLKYNPEQSLETLHWLADKPGLLGFEAEQAIKRWEEGSWRLE